MDTKADYKPNKFILLLRQITNKSLHKSYNIIGKPLS